MVVQARQSSGPWAELVHLQRREGNSPGATVEAWWQALWPVLSLWSPSGSAVRPGQWPGRRRSLTLESKLPA